MSRSKIAGEALDVMYSAKKSLQQLVKSNEPINKLSTSAGKFIFGDTASEGIRGVAHGLAENKKLKDVLKGAYTNADKSLNYKAIAGTYVGGTLAARVATGGGVYRDRNGNTNITGIPFL